MIICKACLDATVTAGEVNKSRRNLGQTVATKEGIRNQKTAGDIIKALACHKQENLHFTTSKKTPHVTCQLLAQIRINFPACPKKERQE